MRAFRSHVLLALGVLMAGCTVGPRYRRPDVNVPGKYRNDASTQPSNSNTASLGDEKWWTVFQDEELQKLIRTALTQNYDVRVAATRILQAQAQVGIARADQFPSVSANPGYSSQKIPGF